MADAPHPAALTSFHACDRCGPYTRSAEVWSANQGDQLLSFCQSHADRYAVPMWQAGFRPIMKAPRDPAADDCDTEVTR